MLVAAKTAVALFAENYKCFAGKINSVKNAATRIQFRHEIFLTWNTIEEKKVFFLILFSECLLIAHFKCELDLVVSLRAQFDCELGQNEPKWAAFMTSKNLLLGRKTVDSS